MAPLRPMLGDLELQQVQEIETDGEQVTSRHQVPALEGDFLQGLGRRGTAISVSGVLTGTGSREGLRRLRDKFRAAEPVPFVSDVASATRVDGVLIEDLAAREIAGRPERFAYALTLRELIEPPAVTEEEPPEIPIPPEPPVEFGTLVVEVTVNGGTDFDFERVTVSVRGETEDGDTVARTLTARTDNVWTEEDLPAGNYAVEAITIDTPTMAAGGAAAVRLGETTEVQLDLRSARAVSKIFVIHFRFDKAFIEPCMRPVLKQVAAHAESHAQEKLLIVGHTDKAGSRAYNQSLSERRARSAFAYLTFGLSDAAATAAEAEWNDLRQRQPAGELPTIRDTWDVWEYQYALQDLGFYSGNIDGRHEDLTDDAVEAYRCHKGLPPGTRVDDAVWKALIRDYLAKEPLKVSENRFFRNAKGSCDGGILKWLGCGEDDALKNTDCAFRPSRRTEFLFITGGVLPCDEIAEPVTLRMPPERPAAATWCLGPGDPNKRCCFVEPADPKKRDPKKDEGKLKRPAPAPTFTVEGSIVLQDSQRRIPDTPFANKRFLLTAADGTILPGEPCRGEPQPGRTDGNGKFSFPDLPAGVYTLEVREKVVARRRENEDDPLHGNVVCKEITRAGDRFEVAVEATQLRQVRLPVVAHLMTQVMEDAAGNVEVRSDHVEESELRSVMPVVNFLWGQARIRFDLVNVVREVYRPLRQFELDDQEFFFLLAQGAYPNVINVFCVEQVAGSLPPESGEPGKGVAEEDGVDTPGCALGQLFDPALTLWLAHELGHFLNLRDVTDADRLMAKTSLNPGTLITADEVATTRSSRGAARQCVRLTLEVRGATPFGGPRSPNHVAIRNAAEQVIVEARIAPEVLALGTLKMEGGEEVLGNPLQRRVPRADFGKTIVKATFSLTRSTPQGLVTEVHRDRVNVYVVDFTLEVTGGTACPPGSNVFLFRTANAPVTIRARFPAGVTLPVCRSRDFVRWERGEEHPSDPFLRQVPRNGAVQVEVKATIADLTRSVVVRVIDVRFVSTLSRTEEALERVQIQGVLNSQRDNLRSTELFGFQDDGLFRVRAEIPGVSGDTLRASLTFIAPSGIPSSPVDLVLRRAGGHRFEPAPRQSFLAIPEAIPLSEVRIADPENLRLLHARAGGKLRLRIEGDFCGEATEEVSVRGRVVELCAVIIARPTAEENNQINAEVPIFVAKAVRVYAQGGLELQVLRTDTVSVTPPDKFLNLNQQPCIEGRELTPDEKSLFQIGRDSCPTNFIVYFVKVAQGLCGCAVHPSALPGATVMDVCVSPYTFAHEIGHALGLNHVKDDADVPADPMNLMNNSTGGFRNEPPNRVTLHGTQCVKMFPSPLVTVRG